jgi:polysaccharide export outer membrane protein
LNAPVPVDPGSYKIGSGDSLTIAVFQVADLNRTVTVSETGTILLPLVGSVSVAGLTAQQISSTLTARLNRYLQSPQVSVEVAAYNSQKFSVDGAIKKPGVYPIKGQTSLMQAIAEAGGLGPIADESSVVVFRQIKGRKYAAIFDLNKIRSGQMPDPSMVKNDVVYVEESGTKRFAENLKAYLLPAASFARLVTPI